MRGAFGQSRAACQQRDVISASWMLRFFALPCRTMDTYEGGCHCGRVRFRVTADLSNTTVCNCSMCNKKGFVHLIVEPSQFELLSGEGDIRSYKFNTGIADHKFCGHCGIHSFYTPRSDPNKVDVNVRCLDGVDLANLIPQTFDGRNWEDAIRTAHWKSRDPA
jgi:hypothetical protein